MDLPVLDFSADGEKSGLRDGLVRNKSHMPLDDLLDVQHFIDKILTETSLAQVEEIARLEAYALNAKANLERGLDQHRYAIRQIEDELRKAANVAQKLDVQKKLNVLQKELKGHEQNLFMDKIRLDADMEKQIQQIKENAALKIKVSRIFVVSVKGNN